MESFFHTLKVALVRQRWWATRDEARRDLFVYIERYCGRRRIHSPLGYITPEQEDHERNLLIEQTQSGLTRAKAQGTALGRPAALDA